MKLTTGNHLEHLKRQVYNINKIAIEIAKTFTIEKHGDTIKHPKREREREREREIER